MSRMPKLFDRFLESRVITHASFWIAMVIILAYHGSLFGGDFTSNLINMLAILPIQMLAAYLMTYVQIPKLLFLGKWLLFLISMICIGYVLSAMARLSIIHIAEPFLGIEGLDESLWEILSDPIYLIRVYTATVYIPTALFYLIKMTKERFAKENQINELEKEKKTSELNFLKAQINPHFLFNTLNNIYALARNKSDETPEMILKLSEILDYTIYECKSNRVPVYREWELIENYAELQALRHHDQMTILLHQDIANRSLEVAPLILISLVENAFKHGLKGKREGATIDISLTMNNGILIFKVFNTRSELNNKTSNGIGMHNIQRQLELQYPDQYTMKVDEHTETYEVTLSIEINKSDE